MTWVINSVIKMTLLCRIEGGNVKLPPFLFHSMEVSGMDDVFLRSSVDLDVYEALVSDLCQKYGRYMDDIEDWKRPSILELPDDSTTLKLINDMGSLIERMKGSITVLRAVMLAYTLFHELLDEEDRKFMESLVAQGKEYIRDKREPYIAISLIPFLPEEELDGLAQYLFKGKYDNLGDIIFVLTYTKNNSEFYSLYLSLFPSIVDTLLCNYTLSIPENGRLYAFFLENLLVVSNEYKIAAPVMKQIARLVNHPIKEDSKLCQKLVSVGYNYTDLAILTYVVQKYVGEDVAMKYTSFSKYLDKLFDLVFHSDRCILGSVYCDLLEKISRRKYIERPVSLVTKEQCLVYTQLFDKVPQKLFDEFVDGITEDDWNRFSDALIYRITIGLFSKNMAGVIPSFILKRAAEHYLKEGKSDLHLFECFQDVGAFEGCDFENLAYCRGYVTVYNRIPDELVERFLTLFRNGDDEEINDVIKNVFSNIRHGYRDYVSLNSKVVVEEDREFYVANMLVSVFYQFPNRNFYYLVAGYILSGSFDDGMSRRLYLVLCDFPDLVDGRMAEDLHVMMMSEEERLYYLEKKEKEKREKQVEYLLSRFDHVFQATTLQDVSRAILQSSVREGDKVVFSDLLEEHVKKLMKTEYSEDSWADLVRVFSPTWMWSIFTGERILSIIHYHTEEETVNE